MPRPALGQRRSRVLLIGCVTVTAALLAGALLIRPDSASRSWVYAADVPAWTTFGYDNSRSGNNPLEAPFTSLNKAWESPAMDGLIYAQPLVLADRAFIATENNTVYAVST